MPPFLNVAKGHWEKDPSKVIVGIHYKRITLWCDNVFTSGEYEGYTFGYIAKMKLQYGMAIAKRKDTSNMDYMMKMFRLYMRSVHKLRLRCLFAGLTLKDIPQIWEPDKLKKMIPLAESIAKQRNIDLSQSPAGPNPPIVLQQPGEKRNPIVLDGNDKGDDPSTPEPRTPTAKKSAKGPPSPAQRPRTHGLASLSSLPKGIDEKRKKAFESEYQVGKYKDNIVVREMTGIELDAMCAMSDIIEQDERMGKIEDVSEALC